MYSDNMPDNLDWLRNELNAVVQLLMSQIHENEKRLYVQAIQSIFRL